MLPSKRRVAPFAVAPREDNDRVRTPALTDRDRLTATTVSESTNYLTGLRVVSRGKGNRDTTTKTQISRKKLYLEQIDGGEFESAAYERLKL